MNRPGRETVMTALFNRLTASVQTEFTADTQANSVALGNQSTTSGLFIGLPVFGGSVPRGAIITGLSPVITLSQPAAANTVGVSFTTGFLTFSRRFKFAADVSAQPALYLREPKERLEYRQNIMQELTLKVEVWIYSNAGQNPDLAPIIALNNLFDAVQQAFAPDDMQRGRCTLGGLVEWCRVVGEPDKQAGDGGPQAIGVLDVEIIVP